MERKIDLEYKQLINAGIPDKMAYLVVCAKYKVDQEGVEDFLNDLKGQNNELAELTKEFVPLEENITFIENEIKLKSNDILNDKNEN